MSDLRCPAHPDVHLIEDHRAGDVICPQCGLVVGDRIIDVSSEWRSFNNEKSVSDPSRVGAPENSLLSGSDLSTSIAAAPGSDYASLSNQQRKQMNTNDRQLIQGFQIIRDMADRINLPKSIVDTANRTFKNVTETKALKGRNSEAVAAACLYIACRREDVPRSFKEIVAVSKCSKKELGRVFRLCMKALEANLKIITSQDFMSRFCGNLQLPRKIEAAAIHIAKRAVDLNLVAGRSPISVAAAAIYMASQAAAESFRRKANEISEIAGVAEVTIKQSYRLMLPRAAELFPDDFVFVTPIDQLPNS